MSTTTNPTKIWFSDIQEFLSCPDVMHIIPKLEMPHIEQYNAAVRLSFLIAIVLRVFGVSYLIFILPLVVMMITVVLFVVTTKTPDEVKETFSLFDDAVQSGVHPNAPDALQHEYPPSPHTRVNTIGAPTFPEPVSPPDAVQNMCRMSTYTNPFGNTQVTDMQKKIPPACSRKFTPFRKTNVNRNFEITMNKSVDDVYNNHASQRQYFTMPWTQGFPDPNNDFPSWLYDIPPILKEQVVYQLPLQSNSM